MNVEKKVIKIFFLKFVMFFSVITNSYAYEKNYSEVPIDKFKKIKILSGNNYYYNDLFLKKEKVIRAHYFYPWKTVTLGYKLDEKTKKKGVNTLSWKWRVIKFPTGADERVPQKNDSAGSVYCFFKSGIKTYVIKYVYSKDVPIGTIIKSDKAFIRKQRVMIVNNIHEKKNYKKWKNVKVNFIKDFNTLFKNSTAQFMGIGIMTDGDATKSEVITDYSKFIFSLETE